MPFETKGFAYHGNLESLAGSSMVSLLVALAGYLERKGLVGAANKVWS